MRFLVDEMFGAELADRIDLAGFSAAHVRDLGLAGAPDSDVLDRAVKDEWVLVTENAVDFIPLLDARTAAGEPLTAVVIALRKNLPRGGGAMTNALARKLAAWAEANRDPYPHVHWLG